MGPEPMQTRPAQLARRLANTTRAIKNALLDQTVLAGLGNIYVDESLFDARIHPLTPARLATADQIARLNRSIKTTLRRACVIAAAPFATTATPTASPAHSKICIASMVVRVSPAERCRTPITASFWADAPRISARTASGRDRIASHPILSE